MKQWKDNEKLTGVDYTHERKEITKRLEEADTIYKNSQASIILSDFEPVTDKVNTIWLDPNEISFTNVSDNNITVVANVRGLKRLESFESLPTQDINFELYIDSFKAIAEVYDGSVGGDISTNISLEVYKDQILKRPIETGVTTQISALGYKDQILNRVVETGVTTEISASGYKQQIILRPVESDITTEILALGYKQQIAISAVNGDISLDLDVQGYKQQIKTSDVEESVTVIPFIRGYKHEIFHEITVGHINTTVLISGYKNVIEQEPVATEIQMNVTVEGYKNIVEQSETASGISIEVTAEGYKNVVEQSEAASEILVEATASGFKPQVLYGESTGSIITEATVSGSKVFEITGASNIAFTDTWTIDGASTGVTLDPGSEVIATIVEDGVIVLDAPEIINVGAQKYRYNMLYFTIGSDPTVYQIPYSNLPYNLSVTGYLDLTFNYNLVIEIPIKAKSNIEVQNVGFVSDTFSVSENLDLNYRLMGQFEDLPGNTLRVNAPSQVTYNSNLYNFQIVSWKVFNEVSSSYELVTNVGNGVDFEPDTSIFGPSSEYEQAYYLDVNYVQAPNHTVSTRFSSSQQPDGISVPFTIYPNGSAPIEDNAFVNYTVAMTKPQGTQYAIVLPNSLQYTATGPFGTTRYYYSFTNAKNVTDNITYPNGQTNITGLILDENKQWQFNYQFQFAQQL